MSVGVIGLGNIGTVVADLVARNGFAVLGWDHQPDVVEDVSKHHRNRRYLPGADLHPAVSATHDRAGLVAECDIVFVAVPARFIGVSLEPVLDAVRPGSLVVNLAKGVDVESGRTALELLGELLPGHPLVVLSGPAIANEIAAGMPTAVVIAGPDPEQLQRVFALLDCERFRIRTSDDATGVQLGGILKNIYAIGLGLFDGRGMASINFRAVYLTRALAEMTRIGVAAGARADTFLHLAGVGDLLATALSEHSHNRTMGQRLAEGRSVDDVREELGVLPEGYGTLQAVLARARQWDLPVPIAEALWEVVDGRRSADWFVGTVVGELAG